MFSIVSLAKTEKPKKNNGKKPLPIPINRLLGKFPTPIPERFRDFSESFRNRGGNKYLERHIYFLNIIAMIYKNKYSAFRIIQTMV